MKDCTIKPYQETKTWDVIKELEHNDGTSAIKLLSAVVSKDFVDFVKKDGRVNLEIDKVNYDSITNAFENINKNTVKSIIRNYRKQKFFDPKYSSTISASSGLYTFSSREVFEDAKTLLSNVLFNIYYNADERIRKTEDFRNGAIRKAVNQINSKIIDIYADMINIPKDAKTRIAFKQKNFYKQVPTPKGVPTRTFDFDRFASVLNYVHEKGNDIQKNYADLALTLNSYNIGDDSIKSYSSRFMSEVLANKKISQLFAVADEFDIEDVVTSTIYVDEDHMEDGMYADETDVSTNQWLMDSIKSSSDKFASQFTKLYFESLIKLSSVDNNYQDYYRNNSFGAVEFHNYSDCNNQLLTIMTERGGFKSLDDFIAALDEYGETVPEYRAFAKVADDFSKNRDIAYKIFTDLRNKVIDKVRLSITVDSNPIDVHQANPTNNNENANTFKFTKDIQSSIFKVEHDTVLQGIKRIKDALENNEKLTKGNISDQRKAITVKYIKTVFKQYFPNIDTNVIDSYIKNKDVIYDAVNKKNVAPEIKNIKSLLEYIESIAQSALKDFNDYNINEYKRQQAFANNKAVQQGLINRPLEQIPDRKLITDALNAKIGKLARELSKYSTTKAEYTSRNIEDKQQSDVTYNNFISFVTGAFESIESMDAYVRSKFRGSNLRYSNLVGNHKLSPFAITKDSNGVYSISSKKTKLDGKEIPLAARIIRMKLIDGVENITSDVTAGYTSMSDIDYMGLGLASYIKGIRDYSAYSSYGDVLDGVRTYIMPTPSDAPKNFMITLPSYSAGSEQTDAVANIIKAQIFEALKSRIRIGRANSTADLIDNYDYKKNWKVDDWKKLDGNIFNFDRLFNFDNSINTKARIIEIIDTHIGDLMNDVEALASAMKYDENNHYSAELPVNTQKFINAINELARDWIKVAKEHAMSIKENYTPVFDVLKINDNDYQDYYVNFYIAQTTIDDLFRGAKEFYKDAQTIAKRDKQVQAGGKMYGVVDLNSIQSYIQEVSNTDETLSLNGTRIERGVNTPFNYVVKDLNGNPVKLRTGFNAITIRNSVRFSSNAEGIYKQLIDAGNSKEIAEKLAKPFGYNNDNNKDKTKTNDAQSYITIWEAARRIKARGDFSDYAELLDKLTDKTTPLEEIDNEQLTQFIQVMKHFYYDQYYDEQYDMEVPRQIKNAEFVLIPKMLGHYETNANGEEVYVADTSLGELLKLMVDNDIDQVNTQETSKASNYDIVEFWDADGNLPKGRVNSLNKYIAERKKAGYSIVKPFSYSHLYIQQDVPQHMEDAKNKAGIQIIKKILDNIDAAFVNSGFTTEQLKTPEVQAIIELNKKAVQAKQTFIENYIANIREDFENLMKQYGVKFDADGNIEGSLTGGINFEKVYAAARQELNRLGQDSNMLDYVTEINGETIMPTFMNIVGAKIESIANAQFNRLITRQKLPGWHAAQVTSVGMEGLIQKFKKEDISKASDAEKKLGKRVELAYHKDKNIVEILLPAWTKDILGTDIENIDEDVLEMIGYRIPTEGKQSIAVMKVVGFLPKSMGSTIVVPDEWVTQTGSDFDVDSVYGIIKETYKDEDGRVHVVDENHGTARQLRNTKIVQSMIDILNSPMATAENLSRSNFDDITDANKEVDKLKKTTKNNVSPYALETQIAFRRNAMGGASLKGLSVMLDTACSVFSVSKAYFPDLGINIVYEDGFQERLYKLGWSENNNLNRNGDIITVASSHTTAHILDAVKEGSIENENEYTFQAFKLLFNLGVDAKTAILWIRQPGISQIVKTYFDNNSVFVDSNANPVQGAIKSIAAELGITINKKPVSQYTPIDTVIDLLQAKYGTQFEELFRDYGTGSKISLKTNTSEQGVLKINAPMMIDRLKEEGKFTDKTNRLLFDLGMVINFNNINKQATIMMNYAKVLNTDKFGAAQSIYKTREYLNNISELISNGQAEEIYSSETNTNLIEAIYQGFEKSLDGDKIDINAYFKNNKTSVYPILNAFLKYSTMASLAVNSQLFLTEIPNTWGGSGFYEAVNNLRDVIMRFNETTYNEFKKFAISYFANTNIDFFAHQIKINDKNNIEIDDNVDDPVRDMYNEFKRIFGYGRVNNELFDVADINNITEEELNKYKQLSPAEKVEFIKRHLTNSTRNIFDYLEPRLINYRTLRDTGDTPQTIRFTDNYIAREELYRLFKESFYNSNPLIRLAAIDLIKYAFVAEGNNFRYGNVSKIIPNVVLYDGINKGATGIIDPLRGIPIQDAIVARFIDGNLYEKFIQSHASTLGLKTIRAVVGPKGKQRANFKRYVSKGFDYLKKSIIYKYDLNNSDNVRHLSDLGIVTSYKDETRVAQNYINISFNNTKTLYKIIKTDSNLLYIVPLNNLHLNEVTDFSVDSNLNIHPISKYWEKFIEIDESTTDDVIDLESIKDYLPETKENTKVSEISPNYIETKIGNKPENTGNIALFVDNINARLGNEPNKQTAIFYSTNYELGEQTKDFKTGKPSNKGILQEISNGEDIIRYIVVRKKLKQSDINSDSELANFVNTYKLENSDKFYQLIKYNPKEVEYVDNESADLRSAVDFDNLDLDVTTKLAKQQINDIKRRSTNDEQANIVFNRIQTMGVDPESIESIELNSGEIIKQSIRYHSAKARELDRKLKNFARTGFAVNDPRLIEQLKENSALRKSYLELYLDAVTFGKSFNLINDISLDNFTEDSQRDIRQIREAINDVKNNILLKEMSDIILKNIYEPLSTNINITEEIASLKDYIFKDGNLPDRLFQDAQELGIPLVQIILKQAWNRVAAEKMKNEKEVVDTMREINKLIDDAAKNGTPINWDKIVSTTTGKFLVDFDEKWFEDYKKLSEKVSDLRFDKGIYDKEYLKAKQELNVWLNENSHQKYVSDFYKRINDNVAPMLEDDAIDVYIEYLKLKDRKNELLKMSRTERSVDEQIELDNINKQIYQLMNYVDEFGDIKPDSIGNQKLTNFVNNYNSIKTEYFTQETREGFEDDLRYYLDIIKRKEIRNAAGQLVSSEADLMLDREYADAKRWLAENTRRVIDADFRKKISKAFATLRQQKGGNGKVIAADDIFKKYSKNEKYYDYKGTINGSLFTDAEVEEIRNAQIQQFANFANDRNTGEARLIRNRSGIDIIFNDKFYSGLRPDSLSKETVDSIRSTVDDINKILINARHSDGRIYLSDIKDVEQLKELDRLYKIYHSLRGFYKTSADKKVGKFFAENVEVKTDNTPFDYDKVRIENGNYTKEYYDAWKVVAYGREYDEEGQPVGNKLNDTPNEDIYGFLIPKELVEDENGNFLGKGSQFVDKEKTAAKRFINSAIEFTPTEYYYKARQEASDAGKLAEFEAKNLVYNPYSDRFEPIRIWTQLNLKPSYSYAETFGPNYNNTVSTPYQDTINEDYHKYSYKYNGSEKYKKDYNRTPYEEAISKLMIDKYYKFAQYNPTGYNFTSNLMFPRKGVADGSMINRVKQLLNTFGFGYTIADDRFETNSIGFEYDRLNNLPMMEYLKGKGTMEYKEQPKRKDYIDERDYQNKVKEVREYNRIAKANNDKIDVALMSHDYKAIFEEFLKKAIQVNAVEDTKLDIYYLLEWLRHNEAAQVSGFGNLLRDKFNSAKDLNVPATKPATVAIEMVERWARRFLFDEFKRKNRFDALAGFAQNFTSTKYMMLNIPGGIGNVLTGTYNIMQERTAGEFFGHSEWENAKFKYYVQNIPAFIRNRTRGESDNLMDAVIKMMNIIDYNDITEISREGNYTELMKKLRDSAYSTQSAGEHFLQNTAMIAMMISNRIYTDSNGKTVIGSIHDYTRDVHFRAMEQILADDKNLARLYKNFKNGILRDENKRKDVLWFKTDINGEFLRMIGKDKSMQKYAELYQNKIKELTNNLKKDFETKPRVIDQFELDIPDKGIAQIKKDSPLTWELLGEFKGKVVSVNKKINGIYDKLGAGGIESMWVFGSLAMQYHKHIYMNIMKRYRTTGYWNESRQAIERGYITDLWNFATAEFKDFKKNAIARNGNDEDNQLHFIEAVQELCRAAIDTIINAKFRYNTMNPHQRANIRRAIGTLYYMLGGLALGFGASFALLAMGGNDDDDDAMTLLANLALYEADDILTQTQAFAGGLISSTDKLWSNPVAVLSSVEELGKLAGFAAKMVTQGEEFNMYYTNGRYKGENKFKVLLLKQVPIYSRIDRLFDLNRNNSYYKLGDNLMNFIPVKDITKWIME